MKLHKLLTPFVCTLGLTSGIFGYVSCGDPFIPTPDPDEPDVPAEMETFISDRTFSLMAISSFHSPDRKFGLKQYCYGTGWIISDSTPSYHTDYSYWVATNWHVIMGMEESKQPGEDYPGYVYEKTNYYYADDSCATRSDHILTDENYIKFASNCFEPQAQENFEYNDGYDDTAIDFWVAKCNFANASDAIKTKLNKLNALTKINTFVFADRPEIKNKIKFTAGYPVKDATTDISGGKWEIHGINSQELKYYEMYDEDHMHLLDNTSLYIDVSPQYAAKDQYKPDWMDGGASGSMLITEDYEICGIYWGGEVDDMDYPTWLKPEFSLFLDEHSGTDFITPWLH